jgi:hypothetical protein
VKGTAIAEFPEGIVLREAPYDAKFPCQLKQAVSFRGTYDIIMVSC